MSTDPLRLLALWALIHETADEEWKAAVARGRGSGEFADALAAMVDVEKEKLRASLAGGKAEPPGSAPGGADDLRYELGEVRGRLESLEAAVDALRRLLEERSGSPGGG